MTRLLIAMPLLLVAATAGAQTGTMTTPIPAPQAPTTTMPQPTPQAAATGAPAQIAQADRPAATPETQAKLDRVARGCGLKKGTFTIRQDGLVDTHEPPNSTPEKMNCAYAALAKAGFAPPADSPVNAKK